ncbi:MAG: hypothetical protein FJ290_07675 [Planctomycetes bacterium]|nr:hypothetical protein [Planctomycetota bacterium]
MSGRTQFWVGSLMLAVAVGILVGGLVAPRPTYSQGVGEGRTGGYALVASDLKGTKANAQIVYVLDDRTEALYVIEASSARGDDPSPRGYLDLRKCATKVQKDRAHEGKQEK